MTTKPTNHLIAIAVSPEVDAMKLLRLITAFEGVTVFSVDDLDAVAADKPAPRSTRPANATAAPMSARRLPPHRPARRNSLKKTNTTGKSLADIVYELFAKRPSSVFSTGDVEKAIRPLGYKSNGSTAIFNVHRVYPGKIERVGGGKGRAGMYRFIPSVNEATHAND